MSVQCFLSYHAPKEDYNNKPNDGSAFEVFAVDSKACIYYDTWNDWIPKSCAWVRRIRDKLYIMSTYVEVVNLVTVFKIIRPSSDLKRMCSGESILYVMKCNSV